MRILALALLVAGIGLRIYIYLQNRNLIIDEANIACNIYERGFMALLQPLDYYQYAPPSFLWITKLSSLLFGMDEMELRLYPLLCGIADLLLFYKILRQLMPLFVAACIDQYSLMPGYPCLSFLLSYLSPVMGLHSSDT